MVAVPCGEAAGASAASRHIPRRGAAANDMVADGDEVIAQRLGDLTWLGLGLGLGIGLGLGLGLGLVLGLDWG